VDAVINLAAKHHDFGVSEEEFYSVNVKGTANILSCLDKLGIKKFIFYSTVAVYGDVLDCSDENTVINPVSVYGRTKLEAEKLICEWTAQDATRQAVILRPTVVFGPGNFANMYNLINSIYRRRFLFAGRGNNIKSVAYVENLTEATYFLLERIQPGVNIYNYSDYPQMTIEEIVRLIAHNLSRDMPGFKLPLGFALAAAGIFDLLGKITKYNFPITAYRIKKFNTSTCHKSDKIRELGFRQPVDLPEGFARMTRWYLSNNSKSK